MIFCLQGTLNNLREEQIRSQSDSADTPLCSDDELLLEAVGGVYKSRAYGQGPLPARPRSVYAASSSSSAVSHAEYEAMKSHVAELTQFQTNMQQQLVQMQESLKQQAQEGEQRLREQTEQVQEQLQQRLREQAEQAQQQLEQRITKMFAKFQSEQKQKKPKKSKKNPETQDSNQE